MEEKSVVSLINIFTESVGPNMSLSNNGMSVDCSCRSSGKSQNNILIFKISKGAKIRNRYNQVPHLTQGTNGESDKLDEGKSLRKI